MSTYKDNLCQLIVPKQEFYDIGLSILDEVKGSPDWGKKYVAGLKQKENKLYEASYALNGLNFKKFSDSELLKVYEDYYHIYGELHIYHWIQTALDFDENVFSKYLMAYLKDRVKGTQYSLGDVFSVLTTPTEEAKPTEEYRDLLLIFKDIASRPELKRYFISTETRIIVRELPRIDKGVTARIEKHAAEFGFLGYGTAGPAWDAAYFIDILSSLARQQSEPDRLLADFENNRRQIESRQRQLESDLKLDSDHIHIFQFARDLVFTKGSRKDCMFHSYSVIENLFKEIGQRRYLSLRQVRYLHPHEFRKLLVDDKFPISILNERYQFSLNFSTGRFEEDLNLTGDKARAFIDSLDIIQEDISNIKILYGDCASPGRVRGEVKIINTPEDMAKMNKGDILVSFATTPDLVPAIKKAAAIITDAGGITCHAAIISRELGVPCVVGTKIATKVLHDHDIIDVNATHGKVDIIKKK
jgi:phosphohistidine swiveling domain-containing protein